MDSDTIMHALNWHQVLHLHSLTYSAHANDAQRLSMKLEPEREPYAPLLSENLLFTASTRR